jgi:hypothetical protein
MLDNDPPPGTKVYFVRQLQKGIRTLEAYQTATLEARGGYRIENPDDLFRVNYGGEVFTVRRDEIRKLS